MIMKAKFYGLFLALWGAVTLTSCSNDDDDLRVSDVPSAVMNSFEAKYPNVSRAEWEKKGGYIVADFWQEGVDTHVWYNSNGEWLMTEYDLGLDISSLPQAVQDSFKGSQYATWHVDGLDKYERPNDVFYLIEVETKGEHDRDLFFASDGSLLKDEVDKENNEVTPSIVF